MQEKEFKNDIITISGQPVTGKSTTIKKMIEILIQKGYKKENIHLISTGHEYREYFNLIVEFIKNMENPDVCRQLTENEKLKAIFNNNEYRKVFSECLAKIKMQNIDFSEFTIEQANNMPELSEIRKVVDTIIDEGIKAKGKEINSEERPGEIWIIDSRLAFNNIPKAFAVTLTSSADVAASRLYNDTTRGKEDSKYKSLEDAKEAREKRRIGEVERYKKTYGVDIEDPNNYDLIIDTSYASIEDTADTILRCLDMYREGKYFGKTWGSPKTFLPLQGERDTLGRGLELTFDEILESIRTHGYLPDATIEVIEVDGYKYIYEGHHRNFGAAYLGKTLVPYEVIAKDDEYVMAKNTARSRIKGCDKNALNGHEWLIEHGEPGFTYKQFYPEKYKQLFEEEQEVE